MKSNPVLMLYDGFCGFCNATVRWILKRDRFDRFRFAPQQSAMATEILARHGIDQNQMLRDNSVYLVLDAGADNERLLQRSDVSIETLLALGGVWKVLGYALRFVPRVIRDAGYALTARNRYRFAGRYDSCPIPSASERAKFLGITDS